MAAFNLANPSVTGTAEPAYNAANAGGDSFPIPRPILIKMKNVNAAARTVTLVANRACNKGVLHNEAINVPATSTIDVVVNDVDRFENAGRINMTYSTQVDLSFLAYTL